MKPFVFLHPDALVLLALVPVFMALHLHEARKKDKAWRSYVWVAEGLERGPRRVILTRVMDRFRFVLGLIGLVTALGGPAWRVEHSRSFLEGRDVLGVLDVSQSMAAEDLAPSRLQWAKALLRTWSETHPADRMGLVVFSRKATIRCPLTWDRGFFHSVLDEVIISPVVSQGTELMAGLREAVRLLSSEKNAQRPRILLVLTDGEDHGPDPRVIVKEGEGLGFCWILVGLGDPLRGSRIPVAEEDGRRRFLRYRGAEVWSRMDPVFLQRLADTTPRAVFFEAQGIPEDFVGRIHKHLESLGESPLNYGATVSWREWFQIPLGLGVVCLLWDFCVPNRRLDEG